MTGQRLAAFPTGAESSGSLALVSGAGRGTRSRWGPSW